MTKIAFLYPGQASQYVGMGRDLYEQFPIARDLFDEANALLKFDLKKICFEGPQEALQQTQVTQPAIFVHSIIVTKILAEQNLTPDLAAGHSLGEYSALVAAGVLTFEDGLRVVQKRGELMQMAGTINPGTMAAIIGLSDEQVIEICQRASEAGVVTAANFNSPMQVAISGSPEGVARASELALKQGAKKVIPLVVSGAFHSPLMENAQQELKAMLERIELRPAKIPIYSNVTARPVNDVAEIRTLLYQQLTHPVRWVETIQNMVADGATDFYEVGPGTVLAGLVKRINRTIQVQPKGTAAELSRAGVTA
ncbi:MAG: ACP S-malonyltransferase [candidate division KSB1 bacterium]|nr:ACP S-malonyltransferase [candidate division KSB1 bacterium]MDZ7335756.1 ACP S-malonyltransferase [candidate division KSB1 bacterium]MDZ7357493.1 ACP S-malonyltransferase [candidate division KSB1 bacterium]MDZ7376385.1 ACP S-malonyltransferase [candidate division KSB1 bacterium]MDZ7402076.1 ACP S-malonyltransferase [candidate division KSB1 bacterium]